MQTQTATIGGPSFFLKNVHDTGASLSDQHRKELSVVLSAFRSLRGDKRAHIGYVTVPVTTGKRFYDVLTREGVLTREELAVKRGSAFMYEEIIKPNIDESVRLVDQLGLEEARIFIAPSVFEAKAFGWTDDAYMALWYRVIGEMAGIHKLADGWAYSYGGLREVFFSLLLQYRIIRRFTLKAAIDEYSLENFLPGMEPMEIQAEVEKMWAIRIYDKDGEVTLPAALTECTRVIAELHARGFSVNNLFPVAWNMMQIPSFSPLLGDPNMRIHDDPGYRQAQKDLYMLCKKVLGYEAA